MVRSVLTAASILATEENVFANDFDSPPRSSSEGVIEGQFDDAGKLNHETVSGIFKNIANATRNSNSKLNHHKCFPTVILESTEEERATVQQKQTVSTDSSEQQIEGKNQTYAKCILYNLQVFKWFCFFLSLL